jgi:hypothetical protein
LDVLKSCFNTGFWLNITPKSDFRSLGRVPI